MGVPKDPGASLRTFFKLTPYILFLAAATAGQASGQARTHVVIVVGLGGTTEFRESFHSEAAQIYTALVEDHGVPEEDVVYLGERVDVSPDMISDRSTRANLLQVLGEISQRSGPTDRVLVILIGHGTDENGTAQFNVPGPDVTPADFELSMVAFPTQSLALVHTGSASGGFVGPLSGPNRIVIAATRTQLERNATEFGQFFAEAVSGEGADLDHDERISLLEAYVYARQEVERHYQEQNEILTEHAVLDDNGDGEGNYEASLDGPDGLFAATFTLGGSEGEAARTTEDAVLAQLYGERDEIQGRIDALRIIRDSLSEDDYLDRMEPLLVELALKTREIRERGGGGA